MELEKVIKHQVLEVAKKVEEQIDAELEKLDKLDLDDIENLREKRLRDLKKQQSQRQEWIAMGHGEYSEISDEKEFFEISKKSPNIVCHFYKNDSPRCKILDHHLKSLSKKHLETRFITLDVEKAPFLTERLRIKIIPTIALIKDSKTKDYIVGFTDLGNCDDFSTEMLEWRIAQCGVINYTGDLLTPPDQAKGSKKSILYESKKTIRGGYKDDSSDDEFLND